MGRYPLFEHYPYTLALASKQHEVALREKLDLLHVHYAIPHATTAWLAREMLQGEGRQLKVITTLHGTDITLVGQEACFYAITKFSIEQSDAVTAVSAYLRDETYRAFGCVSCDVQGDPQLRQPRRVPARTRRSAGRALAPEGHRRIMHISNFREVKRVKDVVRIFARIRRAMPATLRDGGRRPRARPTRRRRREELGVAEDVRFLGRLDSVATLLQGCELFLLPSTTESFGLAALEAMACGAVVVATRVGGLPEVIDDGVNGILEPVGSVEAMGRRAVDLLRDPGAPRADARGRRRPRAASSRRTSIVPMYEALYDEGSLTVAAATADLVAAHPRAGRGRHRVHPGVVHRPPHRRGRVAGPHGETWKTFEVVIQLGAILAVVWHYRALFLERGARASRRTPANRKFVAQPAHRLPPGRGGRVSWRGTSSRRTSSPRAVVAWALIVGGVAILIVERLAPRHGSTRRRGTAAHARRSAWAWRRCSRSCRASRAAGPRSWAATRSAARGSAAAEFSFFLAVPVMLAAIGLRPAQEP